MVDIFSITVDRKDERVNGHDDKPVLIANHTRDLLYPRHLPAMLTIAQTAVPLNRGEGDIPVLVRPDC